jgi:hypothetical protein
MLTGLSTDAPGMLHSGASSGACRLTDLARTSTGRGTRRRGNPVRTGTSSGSVRLSDQGFQRRFRATRKDRAGSRPQTICASARGIGNRIGIDERRRGRNPRRTGIGQEPPGYSRPSPGSPADADAKALNLNGQVPTRTWWGDVNTGSTGFSSPCSILGSGSRRRFPSLALPPALVCRHAASLDSVRRQPPTRSRGRGRRDSHGPRRLRRPAGSRR